MPRRRIIEYLVRPDRTVLEVGGGWNAFAESNEAPGLLADRIVGRSLDDFVSDAETRLIYKALVERLLQTGEPIRFPYRCDSPDCRRYMTMELDLPAPEVIRFRSRVLREEPREAQRLLDPSAPRSQASISICGWCKRVRTEEGVWLDIEDYVERTGVLEDEKLPRLSHGVCPHCEAEMEVAAGVGS